MKINQATVIKVGAVATALPRWVGSMLIAEGTPLPDDWKMAWRISVVLLTVGMAIAEAWGISFMLHAYRTQKDKAASWLVLLLALNLTAFTIIATPYCYANMRGLPMTDVLAAFPLIGTLWAACVPLSTGLIVAGVGYADKTKDSGDNPKGHVNDNRGHVTDKSDTDTGQEMSSRWHSKSDFVHDPDLSLSVTELAAMTNQTPRNARRWMDEARKNGRN